MADKTFGQKQFDYTNLEIADLLEWIGEYMQHDYPSCATQHGKMRNCNCGYDEAYSQAQNVASYLKEQTTNEI